MSLFETILSSVIGGGFDAYTTGKQNDNTQEAVRLSNQGLNDRLDKIIASGHGTNDTTGTISMPNASGGTDTKLIGGSAQDTLNEGDKGRANTVNDITRNFKPKISFSDAQDAVNVDNQNQFKGFINPAMDKFNLMHKRQFGGLNNSGEPGNYIDNIAQMSAQHKIGGTQEASDFFDRSRDNDLIAAIKGTQLNAPKLNPVPGANGAITNAITQQPQETQIPNSVYNPASIVNKIGNQLQVADNNKVMADLAAALRGLGNSGSFSGGGIGSPTTII